MLLSAVVSSDFYEPSALMLEEEGAVIVGLLVGLNVIDANLCVKGEDLDSQVPGTQLDSLYCRLTETQARLKCLCVTDPRRSRRLRTTFLTEDESSSAVSVVRCCVFFCDLSPNVPCSKVGVIDFSMYLKNDVDDYRSEERSVVALYLTCSTLFVPKCDRACFYDNRNSHILDQKNYVEELNRQLK